MSVRKTNNTAASKKNIGPGSPIFKRWSRNPSWLTFTRPSSGDQQFIGLFAVTSDSSFLAVSAAGAYTVDWGDGSATENIATGVQANHTYDYTSGSLSGTDAPVTFQDSGDTITRTAHGYTLGMQVSFYNIVSTTGIEKNTRYFVISPTANTFQVSDTENGTAIALTTDGSGTLLPYKQVIVTIVPQAGQNLTAVDISKKNSTTGLNNITNMWLDIAVAGSLLTSFGVRTTQPARLLEQAVIVESAIADFTSMFNSCTSLQSVPVLATSSGTNFTSMFQTCSNLTEFPIFDTSSGTNFTSMFQACPNLVTIPLLNTSAGTIFNSMFASCYSLVTIPLIDTGLGTDFALMFNVCSSLQQIPLLDTSSGLTFTSMFASCQALVTIPLIDTSGATAMGSMFNNCVSLETIPLLDTGNNLNMSGMFTSCVSLSEIPLLNTIKVTNFTSTFQSCSSLVAVPLFNTVAGTNFSSTFNSCSCLIKVPLFNLAAATTTSNMFASCSSLQSLPQFNVTSATTLTSMFTTNADLASVVLSNAKVSHSYSACKFSRTALEAALTALPTTVSAPAVTVSSNWGSPTPVSLSGTTTSGSATITMASTTGLVTGMQVTGTGTALTTTAAVTFQDAGDTVTRTAHGLSNGDLVSFATIVTTTGISTFTLYYVISSAANTFQVSLTAGGAARTLTTNGSGTMYYRSTIVSIVTNTSVTLDHKATSSGTNTLAYRLLNTGVAIMKGWSVVG